MTSSHHNSPCWSKEFKLLGWSNTCVDCQSSPLFPWWLTVITIVPMMTYSHHHCFHDDFQSSQTLSTLKQHLCWLPVISTVITCSHDDGQSSLLFHNDFRSSQLCPRWSNTCADCQSSLSFPWWLQVITTNAIGGIRVRSQSACSG